MARIDRVTFKASVAQSSAIEQQNRALAVSFVSHAQAIENPTERAAAVADALALIGRKVSVRGAAKLAGIADSTGLARYFRIAAAMAEGVPAPSPHVGWPAAIEHLSLTKMAEYLRVPRTVTAETLQARAERDVQRVVNSIATIQNRPAVDKVTGKPERDYYVSNMAEWLGTQLLAVAAGEAPYWDLTKLVVVAMEAVAPAAETAADDSAADNSDEDNAPLVERIA